MPYHSNSNSDYGIDRKHGKMNMTYDRNPNSGEGKMHFTGNTEGGRTASVIDSAGIGDGLNEVSAMPVKDGEPMVTLNQRPESYRKKIAGGFVCGT